ncbi:MAG: sigma-70 family RNA polymerase sigma factor [Ignavibacteriales bacterium]|nr:sigma-70 family RNA polymerase sigma factor [Ignavibacteriales bacterium]
MKSPLLFLTTDARILDLIRKGDEEALVLLYDSTRRPIVNLVMRNSGSSDDAEDVLQESLIVLWERVRAGKFEYKAKLSTFVYATAKNVWSQTLRRKGREVSGNLDPDGAEDPAPSALENLIASEQALKVSDALGKIGEQCRKLLLLFYWDELSMDEIAVELGFANADTAKAKKYQCKKALEEVLRKKSG